MRGLQQPAMFYCFEENIQIHHTFLSFFFFFFFCIHFPSVPENGFTKPAQWLKPFLKLLLGVFSGYFCSSPPSPPTLQQSIHSLTINMMSARSQLMVELSLQSMLLTLHVLYHTISHQLCQCEVKDVHGLQSFVSTHSEESDSLLFILSLQ